MELPKKKNPVTIIVRALSLLEALMMIDERFRKDPSLGIVRDDLREGITLLLENGKNAET